MDGRNWRTTYSAPDNTKREGLDSIVWPGAFERMEQFIRDTGLSQDVDMQMPVMNGYEATKQIRALDDPALAGITILAMTANAFDEDRKKALKCGMDGFLSKPIVIEDLKRAKIIYKCN